MGFRYIFYYEYKKLYSERTFWIISVLLVLFFTVAFFNGYSWREFQKHTIEEIDRKEKEQLQHYLQNIQAYDSDVIGFDHPGNAQGINTGKQAYVTKTPHPNAIYFIGQSDLYPFYFRTSPLYGESLVYNHEILNPLNLLIGKVDFSFVALYLLPLLIIAISYDLRSSEKELGTARLVHTYYKSINHLLIYKLLFRIAWFGTIILVCSLCFLILFSRENLYDSYLKEFCLIMISTFGYMAFWFSLAFFFNSLGKSSLVNGIMLVSTWLILVFMLPSLLNTLITKSIPLPSRNQQIIEAREINEKYTVLGDSLYTKLATENPSYIIPTSDTVNGMVIYSWYPPLIASNMAMQKELKNTEARFRATLDRRDSTLSRWRFISPSLVFGIEMSDLSRNGRHDFAHFQKNYEQFKDRWSTFTFDKVFRYEPFSPEDILQQQTFKSRTKLSVRNAFVYISEYLYLYLLSVSLVVLGLAIGRKAL